MPHQCDSETTCWSLLQFEAARAADSDVGAEAGAEAGTGAGTAVCTAAGAEAEAWLLRGTSWMRQRRKWTSPDKCG